MTDPKQTEPRPIYMDITCWHIGDEVVVRIDDDGSPPKGRRRVMYDGYNGVIRQFRGEDGPDLEAFVESAGFQTVAFKEWFRSDELRKR